MLMKLQFSLITWLLKLKLKLKARRFKTSMSPVEILLCSHTKIAELAAEAFIWHILIQKFLWIGCYELAENTNFSVVHWTKEVWMVMTQRTSKPQPAVQQHLDIHKTCQWSFSQSGQIDSFWDVVFMNTHHALIPFT